MTGEQLPIAADCPLFACRVCRTKTGWPHQSWCPLAGDTAADCGGCRYQAASGGGCAHPSHKKGGDAL